MNKTRIMSKTALAAAITALVGGSAGIANATEPCGDFGECKVLVEMNTTDGDIGFHFLMDGDDLESAELRAPPTMAYPDGEVIFSYEIAGPLLEQYLTETFAESAEPPCSVEVADEGDEDEVVTLADFIDRWTPGIYTFKGNVGDPEEIAGTSSLTFDFPAAPAEVEWEAEKDGGDIEGEISWEAGDDLGECADYDDLAGLVATGDLPQHPEDVMVAAWEVVLEPDVDDGDPLGAMTHVVRIPGDAEELEVEVPDDYLETLPDNTPAKAEVGAIGIDDNATFTEIDEICLNDTDPKDKDKDGLDGCGFEIE